MPLPPSPIGFDASVLINFCKVGRLDLIVATCPPPRYVMVDVLRELEDPECADAVRASIDAGDLGLREVEPHELPLWAEYTERLDPGESATLTAAVTRGWSVAVDERAARKVAERAVGTDRITGTVGVLRAAVDQQHITIREGNHLLHEMIAAGYRSPVASLDEE